MSESRVYVDGQAIRRNAADGGSRGVIVIEREGADITLEWAMGAEIRDLDGRVVARVVYDRCPGPLNQRVWVDTRLEVVAVGESD